MTRVHFLALLLSTALVLSSGGAATAYDNRDVVRDYHGQVIRNTFGNCVRTKWLMASDACSPPVAVQKVQEQTRTEILKEDRTVYFAFNKATLTSDSRQRLDSLATTLKSARDVRGARIVGYADRIGTASYNEKLSKKRAETVRSYLVTRGYINSRVAETRWLGESEPKTNCPNTLSHADLVDCLQKDRRVEVEIDYLPVNAAPQ